MKPLIATPKENLIYKIEQPRLSSQILKQLAYLKNIPTKAKLEDFEKNIETLLAPSINRVAYSGYQEGCKLVEEPLDAVLWLRINRDSKARAKQAAKWIANTTGVSLDIVAGMSKDKALSSGRADTIATNELDLGFFGGIRWGWSLNIWARKTWILSDEHDNDDLCDDNVEDGPIEINEVFSSGDIFPPAHIWCGCSMGLVKLRSNTTRFF